MNDIYIPEFEVPVIKIHFDNWKHIKETILDKVLKSSTNVPDNVVGKPCCTTSYFSNNDVQLYSEFIEMINSNETFEFLNKTFIKGEIRQIWYQKYVKGEYHPAHNHVGSDWSAVFYANYDHVIHKPTILHTKEPIDYEIVEGDLLIFPGLLFHEVPECETDVERIVFSFNIKT